MKFFNKDLEQDIVDIPKGSSLRRMEQSDKFFIEVNSGDYMTSRFYMYNNKAERNIDYRLLRQIMRLKRERITDEQK